ncbi:tRNA (guanosine(37)-N1)-methyltransferase TrmD [candidate division WOR-1 bacterium RIFOXYB2_FULL_42_35]|uniref:tRNA (guanine-N(1)-)-methyltransferase n=1 Tax=candidate division WOR-1 bacterium RIFOXYC2_FULL_41_25 TaxID=1802586 RepID=A0A1F4TSJ6_UNCSA|nr:MAG: tRNA (guanosine(37)-N1)-methyltransferase TrmD [candidate division WOR-1 bacterium RIFOXYA2_FULL_41_14]OGC24856.1 MAG: tRNA (guanosine(37)-N1)-methyltransferase TrmD [candidate division WOR-1 bacterium RIFOXYB2_FULL_42_35]OGC35043.1 MAG: tRNA (guanosine(37)-N1)-methyltransferase TrmD [candidate division WOR-1 bacterium RIFOXYC2_FULL_41_25]OGC43654.1 MAG: tRNA (guanosine(37)-N1)-methyltransferase TrmD [candidate division WOR-1 bacterium RIFOXYD2_FULL_41_8]
MKVDILTLFPEMFQGPFSESLLKKAQAKGLFIFNLVNLRDFTSDKHKITDDTAYGGGPGMVMKGDVIKKAQARAQDKGRKKAKVILMCPTGKLLTQEKIKELAKEEHLMIICGHYEGIDERVRSMVDEEISIGDYVLTGGEIPAMVLVDAIARHVPGVVKEEKSVSQDSFYEGLLDYPSYTKPEDLDGEKVPEVLCSGRHKDIDSFRRKAALKKTLYRRPDLLAKATLSTEDKKDLSEIIKNG